MNDQGADDVPKGRAPDARPITREWLRGPDTHRIYNYCPYLPQRAHPLRRMNLKNDHGPLR